MNIQVKVTSEKAIPPMCLWRAIASLFSNGTMIIGKAIGIRPIVPMAATLPFTQGRVGKKVVGLVKRFFLTFTFSLLPFTLLLSSCKFKIKPTYDAQTLPLALNRMCAKEYHLSIQTRVRGDNLQIFVWKVGLLSAGRSDIRPEAAETLERILLCATRVSLSTNASLQFIEIKMVDVLTGASVSLWRYVPDIRDSMYDRMGEEEYINRLVVDVDPNADVHSDLGNEVRWDPPMTMDEFIAKQVVLRAKRQSPVSLQAHEVLSEPRTLVVVIDNWSSIEKQVPSEKEKITDLVAKEARSVVKGYQYRGFHDIIIQDPAGMPVRRWSL